MKDKRVRDYMEKYGIIPKDFCERFECLINKLRLTRQDIQDIQNKIRKISNQTWSKISFVIYLEPKATPRPRVLRTNRSYVPNAQNNRNLFNEFKETSLEDFEPICTPCKMSIKAYLPIPNSMSKIEKVLAELGFIKHISKPDWDNLGKTYSDMIQPALLIDDSLIFESSIKKFYSTKPRVEIQIEYLNKFDCKYNKEKVKGWKYIQTTGIQVDDKWEENEK